MIKQKGEKYWGSASWQKWSIPFLWLHKRKGEECPLEEGYSLICVDTIAFQLASIQVLQWLTYLGVILSPHLGN